MDAQRIRRGSAPGRLRFPTSKDGFEVFDAWPRWRLVAGPGVLQWLLPNLNDSLQAFGSAKFITTVFESLKISYLLRWMFHATNKLPGSND